MGGLRPRHAQVIGMSGDLAERGSFMTQNDLGVRILATRDKKGVFHAHVIFVDIVAQSSRAKPAA
jgi:hypothetical protein